MDIFEFYTNPEELYGYNKRYMIPPIAYQKAEKLGKRISKAEPYIAKDPYLAVRYAIDVIDGRWPEAEPYIMKDPQAAYRYAFFVINGRWLETEPYITKDPYYAYLYVVGILKKRWKEAEPYIKKDPSWWERYKTLYIA